jgi:hypothetical protein
MSQYIKYVKPKLQDEEYRQKYQEKQTEYRQRRYKNDNEFKEKENMRTKQRNKTRYQEDEAYRTKKKDQMLERYYEKKSIQFYTNLFDT